MRRRSWIVSNCFLCIAAIMGEHKGKFAFLLWLLKFHLGRHWTNFSHCIMSHSTILVLCLNANQWQNKRVVIQSLPHQHHRVLSWLVLICIHVANIIICHSDQQYSHYLLIKTTVFVLRLLQCMELTEEVGGSECIAWWKERSPDTKFWESCLQFQFFCWAKSLHCSQPP